MSTTTTSTETRALALLGQGLGPEMVASAVGITVSRISQLLSDPIFSAQVAELRFTNLAKHNERDNKYDRMEEALQERMENLIPMMFKPAEVLRAIQVINAAKRRGSSAPESILNQQTVVALVMPTAIYNSFTAENIQVNINNQVIKAGEQNLVTMQSGKMDALISAARNSKGVNQNDQKFIGAS